MATQRVTRGEWKKHNDDNTYAATAMSVFDYLHAPVPDGRNEHDWAAKYKRS